MTTWFSQRSQPLTLAAWLSTDPHRFLVACTHRQAHASGEEGMRQDVRGLTAKHHRNSDTKLSMQRGTHASTMGQSSAKPAPAPNFCACFEL